MSCTSKPPILSVAAIASNFPVFTGRLLYHSYVNYGDGSSHLFLYDFSTQAITQIDQSSWGVTDPMNAMWSPDGTTIVFMGRVADGTWNIFTYNLQTLTLVNLTQSTGGAHRNEDPKWYADPTTGDVSGIVFKRDKDIFTMTPTGASLTNVTNTAGSVESSMPFYAPDLSAIYFTHGAGKTLRVMKITMPAATPTVAVDAAALAQYYPIVSPDGTVVFYSRWHNTAKRRDQTVNYNGSASVEFTTSDCSSDNSDAWPVSNTACFFSSDQNSAYYKLFYADSALGSRWALDGLGVNADAKNHLGACYTETRPVITLASR